MRALRVEEVGLSKLCDVPDPVAGPGEVLLSIKHVGLCGTDLNTFIGNNPNVSLPRIPGHELGAEVLACGSGVNGLFSPGDKVVVVPYTACGNCSSCRKGRMNACKYNRTLGVQQDGALSERFVVPVDKLIRNESLRPRYLPLVEPLSVGFHAIERASIQKKEVVVVLGCGLIGLGAVAGAVARGAEVIAIDIAKHKTELALSLGATHAVVGRGSDVLDEVLRITNGEGAEIVIEAVGLPETYVQAIELAGFAGRVVYVGYAKEDVVYKTHLFNLKELDIYGSRNASSTNFSDVIKYLETLGDLAETLISKTFQLEDADQALPYWIANRNSTMKILIEI